MALSLLIYRADRQPFDPSRTIAQIEEMIGVTECRCENIFGALFECYYSDPAANDGGSTLVTVHEDAKAIGMGRADVHAVGFAFAFQSLFDAPLRLINSNYDFDVGIRDFRSAAELLASTSADCD